MQSITIPGDSTDHIESTLRQAGIEAGFRTGDGMITIIVQEDQRDAVMRLLRQHSTEAAA